MKKIPLCPILIDSRNRILRPNVFKGEPGTLAGAAISPGVATGKVRIINSAAERLLPGEVLVAVVADPAWAPLFVGASAVVFQIGGALQHEALCAREYGKPGVSSVQVHADLKTGMLVTVDGNTGGCEDPQRRQSRDPIGPSRGVARSKSPAWPLQLSNLPWSRLSYRGADVSHQPCRSCSALQFGRRRCTVMAAGPAQSIG